MPSLDMRILFRYTMEILTTQYVPTTLAIYMESLAAMLEIGYEYV